MKRMQASYAVIRYIPSILREEFINVGVILVCPDVQFQKALALPSFNKGQGKLSVFGDADGRFVQHAVSKLANAIDENKINEFVGSSIAPDGLLTLEGLSILSRTYNNNIRISEPHPVLSTDPNATLNELYHVFVDGLKQEPVKTPVTRTKMRNKVRKAFNQYNLFSRYPDRVKENIQPIAGSTKVDIYYQNGVAHFYQIIPFTDPIRAANMASSYRMLAADIRRDDTSTDFRDAKFAVFGYKPKRDDTGEIEDVTARLKDDDIELLDYRRDAPVVAEKISLELSADSGVMY